MSDLALTPAHADVLRILAERHGLDDDDVTPPLSRAEIIGRSQVREARVTRSNVDSLINDLIDDNKVQIDHTADRYLNRHVVDVPTRFELLAAGRLAIAKYDAHGRGRCAPGVYRSLLVLQFALWGVAMAGALLGSLLPVTLVALVLQQIILFLALESGEPR